jgi:sulfite reductase (NADPH) flavoprotein alpha-component
MRLPEVQIQVADEPVEPSSELELKLTARHIVGSLAWLIFEPFEVNGYKPASGDLLSVIPPGSKSERLYSLAVLNNGTWGVSVRLVEDGICSGWLHSISLGSKIQVDVKPNSEFHLPMWQDQPMLMIANGSGIGPLLGMIEKLPDDQNAVLIWGLQTEGQANFARVMIDEAIERRALSSWHLACSRPLNGPKRYVQDTITNDLDADATWANSRSRLIICGSHKMEEGVEAALSSIDAAAVSSIKLEGRWQADCY